MARVAVIVGVVFLTVYALMDWLGAQPRHIRILPKLLWLVVILVVPLLGPALWLTVGRPDGSNVSPTRRPLPRSGPKGPDDDPEFLRKL